MKTHTKIILIGLIFTSMYTISARSDEGAIQCANLIYAGMHTSRCFSDEFLNDVQRQTSIPTERRFKSVKLDSDELFRYPFAMITGEDDFHLTEKERVNLKTYLSNGGFILASAGCSNKKWDQAFRRTVKTVFGSNQLKKIPMDDTLFRMVHKVTDLKLSHPGEPAELEGMELNGKLVLVYSPQGLNDTAHTEGCCCCGGNEIVNAIKVNVNIFVYSLLH